MKFTESRWYWAFAIFCGLLVGLGWVAAGYSMSSR